jgi:MFS family permease
MEAAAARHGQLAEPRFAREEADAEVDSAHGHMPYRTVLGNPVYLRRVLLLVVVWLTGYVTVYGFSAGFTSVLTAQGYAPPEAGVIVAVGAFGFLLCAVAAVLWSERLNRKVWLPISAVVTLIGCLIIAAAGDTLGIAFIGSGIIFFGFNLWVPMTYARSAESFPTRARTTGFALVDGVGHLGGGIGVLLIAPAVPHLSILASLLLIAAGLVVAAVVGSFGIETRNRRFEEVSP